MEVSARCFAFFRVPFGDPETDNQFVVQVGPLSLSQAVEWTLGVVVNVPLGDLTLYGFGRFGDDFGPDDTRSVEDLLRLW
ncbi:hypothetical protein SADFL11_00038310 [Roseibium alexandrii DFL-11]|uniref:Uncharacterized protein n=1 Tax=Roseibium alexandrii (strain DSM 17067 / NCIMB 14079 / DFL-11) TaxID=244592 RepID=A0A5E8UXK9_ROSAD|nr:hypothetical protein SADFL11_00038310 [Roseibium alexandrii DFL-11]